ncbi:MAG: heme biosynthesis protein HemY [Rhodobacteraceae bacterium]|nr:heme biosynthesis protein HemY [Paracoccaceae bacterium]
MIWSLLKILAFIAAVTGLTYGAVQLSEMSGGAIVTLGGQEITLSPLKLAFVAIAIVVGVWVLLKLLGLLVAVLKFLSGDETAVSRYFTRNRERKGYEALSDGLMALASGEGHLALAKANKAERYLDRPDLTTILTAQAAEMAGDRKKAEEAYKRLLEEDRTRFVGIRGIMKQKLADGQTDVALKLAVKAFELKPRHQDTQDLLLQLQAEKGDWKGARTTLNAKLRAGYLPRDVHRRRDAVLALSEAKGVLEEGATVEAREAAIAANKQSPDLIPAAVMAARAYIEKGDLRSASRVVSKAWGAQPHPELAATFAEIAPDETPAERLKRFRNLTKLAPDHAESKMLLAELNIAAEDFPEARRALGDLAETDPTARVMTLMAAIERGSGASEQVVRGWLTRAVSAPRGPQWVCDKCQSIHPVWEPVCQNCSSFDTLSWRRPTQNDTQATNGSELLPLLVGAPDDPDQETDGLLDQEVEK